MDVVPGMAAGRHAAAGGAHRAGWTHLGRMLLPVVCAGCGVPDEPLCRTCRMALPRTGSRVPALAAPHAPATWSAGDYDGVLKRLVLAFKDDGRHDLEPVLARCLGRCADAVLRQAAWVPDGPAERLLVVPVPSSRSAVRRRGADLTAGLAVAAAAFLRHRGWPAEAGRVLRQRRGVRDQAGLSVSARADNLAGALLLRWGCSVTGRTVLLVDDVVTTGATVQAASRALQQRGAHVIGAATVAATPLRFAARRSGSAPYGGGGNG